MDAKLRRLDTNKGRVYVTGDSEANWQLYPSVTTILSILPKTKLIEIEKSIGAERLKELGRKGALRGTAMHLFLENYFICLKKYPEDRSKCLLYTQRKSTDQLLHEMDAEFVKIGRSLFYKIESSGVFDDIKKVLYNEKFLFSSHGFAGASDFGYLSITNDIVIIDFKSASAIRDEETINGYKLQLAAYVIAFEERVKKKVDRTELWIGHPDGFQHVILQGEELEEYKIKFINLCKLFHKTWDNSHFYEELRNELLLKQSI